MRLLSRDSCEWPGFSPPALQPQFMLTDEAEVTAQSSVKRSALGINIIFVCLQHGASSPIDATDSLSHTVGLCGLFGKETANNAKISSEGS